MDVKTLLAAPMAQKAPRKAGLCSGFRARRLMAPGGTSGAKLFGERRQNLQPPQVPDAVDYPGISLVSLLPLARRKIVDLSPERDCLCLKPGVDVGIVGAEDCHL